MKHSDKPAEEGYELWLRYVPIEDEALLATYRTRITSLVCVSDSPTLKVAQAELLRGIKGLLGVSIPLTDTIQPGAVVFGHPDLAPPTLGDEGYIIKRLNEAIVIAGNTDIGVLYGVFHFLRLLQTHQPLDNVHIESAPKLKYRILNHWDNLDGTIERGYAGFSFWDWHKLPDYLAPRYTEYARAVTSIGINGAALTNVNANALSLTPQYLRKAAALADLFRPYGIRVYLSARFSAPLEIAGLKTADPLDAGVIAWWQAKAQEIYQIIPDFGGFIVKANSEGQPGPHDYYRSHSDGANLLANALAPFGGIVIWRAFVYASENPEDRTKQAYDDLVPQDGLFAANVLLQVKNGPLDFQPREPYHPIFGAMSHTSLMLEVQMAQEYLGLATHMVYMAPLFKETLDAETCDGPVAKTVLGMAGVANTGSDRNWCGHPFGAANWYTFGRLAWDYTLSSEAIADEWLRMTFSNDTPFVQKATGMMLTSREAPVNYMTPLGLHHIMARSHHYGPGPWVTGGRPDWTSLYYHQADSEGIGFNRTPSGSNAVSQYCSPYREQLAHLDTCPENLLLWFHHVAWRHVLKSGRTLWDELCFKYNEGVTQVRRMQADWDSLAEYVDAARFEHVRALLAIQEKEARWWRDACLLYFQTFSKQPIPADYEQPAASLEYYMNLQHYFVPGIPEQRF
ncbi:MAG: alpha-glucuronidase [Anaerolineae bacterium]|nr:alpha-glucuronidase [Anaerolineae bacterium]